VNRQGVIGLDLGTGGARAVLFGLDGAPLATAHQDYPLDTPHPGWAEQDPETIWNAVLAVLSELAKRLPADVAISGIGVSTIFHSLLAVDKNGTPLTQSIIWADTRARRQVEELRDLVGQVQAFYQSTGCPLHPMYLPAKIRWLQETQPEVFTKVAWFGSLKDDVLARLTGRRVIDESVASATGLFNLHTARWDTQILDAIGISADRLPALVEPTDIVGGLASDPARATGLPSGIPVIAGAGDGVLSSLGSGAIAPGQMTVMIGTSGAARIAVDQPKLDSQGRTWCYYLARQRWLAGAAINNGGLACHWVRDNLLPGPSAPPGEFDFPTLEAEAKKASPGSSGLIFLPFLTGERSPYWNASARGILFGLAAYHGPAQVARSIFEGVCFRMRSIVDALDEVAGPTQEVRAAGGFTRSKFWREMLADILGKPMVLPVESEASAFGAAGLTWLGIGAYNALEDVAKLVQVRPGPSPDPRRHQLYNRLYRLYLDIYWANQANFSAIAALQEELG